MHHAFHVLSDIRTIRMQLLPPVVIVYQQLGRNGVVLFRTRGHRLLYQLALGIDLCVVLVSVIFLPAFLRPSGIRVFVPLLVGLFLLVLLAISFFLVPKLVAATILYGLVLLACVTLAGVLPRNCRLLSRPGSLSDSSHAGTCQNLQRACHRVISLSAAP